MEQGVQIVVAGHELWASAAALRFDWAVANGHPVTTDRDLFTEQFLRWLHTHADSHTAVLARHADATVGVGFVAIHERVPGVADFTRRSADIQSVYVRPEWRGRGIATALTERLVALARDAGAMYVTVHTSDMAQNVYRAAGFRPDPFLLYQGLGS